MNTISRPPFRTRGRTPTGRLLAALAILISLAACNDSTSAPVPALLVVTPDTVLLQRLDSVQLTVLVSDKDTMPITGARVTFASSDGTIISVSATGMVHAVGGIGPATVIVTAGSVGQNVAVNVFGRVAIANAPYGVAASSAGVVYVAPILGAAVRRVNLSTFTLTDAIPVGGDPAQVAFAGAGATALVTKRASGSVGVIDVATRTQVDTIAIPGNPYPIRISANGSTAYVTSTVGWLYKIDVASRTRIDSVAAPDPALQIALGPGDSLLYFSSQFAGTVTEVRTATMVVVRSFATGGTPQGLAVSQNGAELYVADEAGPLRIWSLASASEIDTVATGGNTFGVSLTPDGTKLFVGTTAGAIFLINRVTRAIMHRVDVGGTPRNIAVDPVTGYAVVPNEAGGWIDIVK